MFTFVFSHSRMFTAIPHTFTKRLHDIDVVQNHTATYWAIVKPMWAQVKWYKDGEEVQETRRFHILEDDEGGRYLEIEHALRSDMGTITCKSKDDETEAQLNVAGNDVTSKLIGQKNWVRLLGGL